MKTYLLAPLVLSMLCLLWVFIANRRPQMTGALWPKGLTLSGSVSRPDLQYEGDVVLACSGNFGTIRCRSLKIARGADVGASAIEAAKIVIDGRLTGVKSIAAGKRLTVLGELRADDVRAPRITLKAKARATVLTVTGESLIERHPKADVKGFFTGREEMADAGVLRQDDASLADTQLTVSTSLQ